ncbi:hypothetical protein CWC04_12130 [Pseudoalteromonas sp. S2893]|nr:hypothetical protein X564_19610 [Pseudoalteromonas agarivorans]TMP16132.1 hypothetical protein CWC04_12130 [Pseudoalteromonas sp. S2893]
MPKNQTHCCKFNHQIPTRPTNMRDFITLDVSHTGMRYNQQVIQHTLYFLQTGAFLPPTQRTTALY